MGFEQDFHCDWSIPAERIIKEAEKNTKLGSNAEIKNLCSGFRMRIAEAGGNIDPASYWSEVEVSAKDLLSVDLASIRREDYENAKEILEIIGEIRERLILIKQIFDFELEHFKKLYGKPTIGLAQSKEFESKHPQGVGEQTFRKRMKENFGKTFRELVSEMGFPVIADSSNKDEVSKKVGDELWRVYNKKNNLDPKNRTYQQGHSLPLFTETIYRNEEFDTGFGSFKKAVDEVLIGIKKVEKIDNKKVDELLWKSVKTGKKSSESIEEEKMVKDALNGDIRDVVEKSRLTKSSGQIFNWRFILLSSKYYREFGIQIYDIWMTKIEIENMTRHSVAHVHKQLDLLFMNRKTVNEFEELPEYFSMNSEEVAELEKKDTERVLAFVEDMIKDKFTGRTMSKKSLINILRFFAENEINVAPKKSHFVNQSIPQVKESMELLKRKSAFFRKHPEIPYYLRQAIYKANGTQVGSIEEKIAFFESYGISPRMYVHSLNAKGSLENENLAKNARQIKSIEENYAEAVAYFESNKKEAVETEIIEPLKKINTGRKEISTGILREMGYPYEGMSDAIKEKNDPSEVLRKIRLMLRLTGKIDMALLTRKFETIEAKLTGGTETEKLIALERLKFKDYLKDRGFSEPPEYLAKITPATLIGRIEEIEKRGLPFCNDYWWWLNLSDKGFDVQIESTWLKGTKEERYVELSEIYGYGQVHLEEKMRRREPDTLWELSKILIEAGQEVPNRTKIINQIGFKDFRQKLFEVLIRESKKRQLSEKEITWIARYEKVANFKNSTAENYKGVYIETLCNEADDIELLENPEKILNTLLERYLKRMRVIDSVRRNRMGYASIEYWSSNNKKQDFYLAEMDRLKKIKREFSEEELYKAWDNIDEINEDDVEIDYSGEQKIIFDYLNVLGCYEEWAGKLALGENSIDEIRKKVEIFQKAGINEIELFEEYLDKPLSFCSNKAVRAIKRKISKERAANRLRKDLGIEWDHDNGWIYERTNPDTMLEKYEFVSKGGLMKDFATENPTIIMEYTYQSLEELKSFIEEVFVILKTAKINEKKINEYIREFIKLFHNVVRKIMNPIRLGIINVEVVKEAKNSILKGANEYIKKVLEDIRNDNVWGEIAMEAYQKILFSISEEGKKIDPKDEVGLWERKDQGSELAKEALYLQKMYLVAPIANKYSRYAQQVPIDDLMQEGKLGLMKAIEKFDHSRGVKFKTMSAWWIRASITRYITNHSRTIRISSHTIEQSRNYGKIFAKFKKENGRKANSDEELANFEGISIEELQSMKKSAGEVSKKTESLDASLGEDDERNLHEMIGQEDKSFEEDSAKTKFWAKAKEMVLKRYGVKSERAWNYFIRCYGLGENEEMESLSSIGESDGISKEAVRQTINKYVIEVIKSDEEMLEELIAIQSE